MTKRTLRKGDIVSVDVQIHHTLKYFEGVCRVIGVVERSNGNELWFSKIYWASCPDWKDYYPKKTPFNMSLCWIYDSSSLRIISPDELEKELVLNVLRTNYGGG